MTTRARPLVPLLALAFLPLVSAGGERPEAPRVGSSHGIAVVEDVRTWGRLVSPLAEPERAWAVAVAVASRGTGVSGLAAGEPTPERARERALARCRRGLEHVEASGLECSLYSVDGALRFDFARRAREEARASREECAGRAEAAFYLDAMGWRLGHAWQPREAAPSSVACTLRGSLGPDGSVRAELASGDSEGCAKAAREALAAAAPFGPLFGPLACLEGRPVALRFERSASGRRHVDVALPEEAPPRPFDAGDAL